MFRLLFLLTFFLAGVPARANEDVHPGFSIDVRFVATFAPNGEVLSRAVESIYIVDIYCSGPAQSLDLKPGDLIRAINGVPVSGVMFEKLEDIFRPLTNPVPLRLYVVRHVANDVWGKEFTLTPSVFSAEQCHDS